MTDPMIVDFHTHILPGMDDGSDTAKCSRQMLSMLKRQGVTHVAATPHFYAMNDRPDRFLERREKAVDRLRSVMEPGFPQLLVGAEVHYFQGISNCDDVRRLALGDTDHILVEMPYTPWTPAMLEDLSELKHRQGLTPIIAHVDRYMGPIRSHGVPQSLRNLPVVVQINTAVFLHPIRRRMALRLLQEGTAHILGTDCHNLTSRPPDMDQALMVIRRHLGDHMWEQILENSRSILGNFQ